MWRKRRHLVGVGQMHENAALHNVSHFVLLLLDFHPFHCATGKQTRRNVYHGWVSGGGEGGK